MKKVFSFTLLMSLLLVPCTFAGEDTNEKTVDTVHLQQATTPDAPAEAVDQEETIDVTAAICPAADDKEAFASFMSTGTVYKCIDASEDPWCAFLNCPAGTQCGQRHFVFSGGCCNNIAYECVAECDPDFTCGFACP